ncbi:hypothetical protein [Bradyrhizobium prioriisuperbiae]|uniref:hypothetical protein n=1 Tax=Bradyrhizobium prioriisuperbiae TaxID=2854389 RepID=UPI0028E6F56D|nr:hypothetical protein [Bradyrhizobium prioritasuperba]
MTFAAEQVPLAAWACGPLPHAYRLVASVFDFQKIKQQKLLSDFNYRKPASQLAGL